MRTDERLFTLEQQVKRAVTRDDMKAKLEMKAGVDRMNALQESLQRLLVQSADGKAK